ncbi:MAG: hypothetical protein K9H26_01695 [Prolixibacteraceae bacterium]|nr:hypothetical protein [Prolixibacteraceae bacterium]
MKAIEFQSKTDKTDQPETNVRVIVLIDEEVSDIEDNKAWAKAIAGNPSFDFLKEPEEDIYTLNDR